MIDGDANGVSDGVDSIRIRADTTIYSAGSITLQVKASLLFDTQPHVYSHQRAGYGQKADLLCMQHVVFMSTHLSGDLT